MNINIGDLKNHGDDGNINLTMLNSYLGNRHMYSMAIASSNIKEAC